MASKASLFCLRFTVAVSLPGLPAAFIEAAAASICHTAAGINVCDGAVTVPADASTIGLIVRPYSL